MTDEHSSTLILSCETLLGYGVAGEGKGSDRNGGFGNIIFEVIGVANAMNEFMTGLVVVALRSDVQAQPKQSTIVIEHAPLLNDAVLPVYSEGA